MDDQPIIYTASVDEIEASSLAGGFFEGWATPLTPTEHLQLLRRASHVVLAMEGSAVVGFVNALSDGIVSAYIPLLEVLPEHCRSRASAVAVARPKPRPSHRRGSPT